MVDICNFALDEDVSGPEMSHLFHLETYFSYLVTNVGKGLIFFEENQEILKVYLVRKFSTYHQQDQVQLIIKPNSSHTFSTVDCPKAQYLHKPKERDKKHTVSPFLEAICGSL